MFEPAADARGFIGVDELQRAVHIHPTVNELIPTLLGQLKPLGPQAGDAR